MAALDKHLRTASGLRLQLDGTCSFVFEEQTFVIEAVNEHNGDYIFYTGLGSARRLQRLKGWRPQYLLRLLAQWNEELKDRRADGEKAGVLRIDSSKPEGAQVAFIYYGNVNEVKSSSHFQEALDDFVDDALHFSEKLHGAVGFEDGEEVQDEDESRATWEESHSKSSHSFGKSNNSLHASSHSINASSHSFHKSNHSLNASQSFHKSTASLNTTSAVTSSDIFHATANSKKSVLSKMMESFRSKSSAEDIGAVAFVDPNSSACAFVVDRPREGDEPRAYQTKKGSSFRDDGAHSSFHSSSRSFTRSRRHSAQEPESMSSRSFHRSRRHRAEDLDYDASSKSIDIYDDGSRRTHRTACSDKHHKGGGRHRHRHHKRMNMSEPILRSGS
ncbi:hypothetical protein ACHAXT_003273 [Thalassiosira profunda]